MDTQLLDLIASTTKRKEKEQLLAKADETTIKAIWWALNPFKTFGVTVANEPNNLIPLDTEQWIANLFKLLSLLSSREVTGNAATAMVQGVLVSAPTQSHTKWATRVINKDLRAGLGISTVNKVYPNCIPEFAVSLAKPFTDKHLPLEGTFYVEPKLDGLRMVVYMGEAYTRTGKKIISVGHILQALKRRCDLYSLVLDGEVMGIGDFDTASGSIRQRAENTDSVYHIFDTVPVDQWSTQTTDKISCRKEYLSLFSNMDCVKVVPWSTVTDPSFQELERLRDAYIDQGFEGAMLKRDVPYNFKRSDALLKLKTFQELDGVIVGKFEGKGKHKGKLGGLIVSHDNTTTEVGSGFTDEQREQFWNMDLIDEIVEVKYQNKTKTGSLRFPVFLRLRGDKV